MALIMNFRGCLPAIALAQARPGGEAAPTAEYRLVGAASSREK